jgi:uncharacterized RDD family membrane protein YckC
MTEEPKPQKMIYGQYAGFVTRLVAFVVDLIIVVVLVIVGNAAVGLVTTVLKNIHLVRSGSLTDTIASALAIALGVVIFVAYYIGFWLGAGQTPGKRFMGVRIVRRDGGRVVLWNVGRRFLGYWLSSILFLGFLWILVDNQRQAWHDSLSGTIVIYSRPTPREFLISVPGGSSRPKHRAG